MVKKLDINLISISGGTQPRTEINQDIINDYAIQIDDHGAVFPPVTVFFDGVKYWLADGFHRYWANKKILKREIECDIKEGTQRHAVLYSCGANNEHGLRRTNADKRKSVETLLKDEEWGCWSDNKVAEICKVSFNLVSNIRAEINPKENHTTTNCSMKPETRSFIHPKTGKETTMNVSNIGRKTTFSDISHNDINERHTQMSEEEKIASGDSKQYNFVIRKINKFIKVSKNEYPNNKLIQKMTFLNLLDKK